MVAIPAIASIFARASSLPACLILTPVFKPAEKSVSLVSGNVVPIPTIALLDMSSIELFGKDWIRSFATLIFELKNLTIPGAVLNLAL